MIFEFSAGAILYKDDGREVKFLLLIKENKEYDIPKGHIEKGETAAAAAKREIFEEAGAKVEFVRGFSTSTRYFFYRKREKVVKRLKIFLSEAGEGKVKISSEHIGFEWVGFDDAVKKIRFKDMQKVFMDAMDYIKKAKEIQSLNREYEEVRLKHKNWDLSKVLVPGEGPLNAKVMALGQAPGRFEDERRKPFVGRSGMLLSNLLKGARLNRDSVYITSVVQFFPPKNRMPTGEEVEICIPFLKRQIEIVRPSFIILMGSLSSKTLAGVESVEKDHGKVIKKEGITYMVTFHPAAALRFSRVKELMLEDLKKFSKIIKESAEKQ